VGKYQLVNKLATGGMAEVFLAKVEGPMGFEKTLVLKRILPHLAEDPQFVGMFFTEARVAAQLNHPNVVQIFDFGQADGTYYLAMEHIDGPDLRTLAARAVQAGVSLPPAFCAKLISAACEGLAFAHDFTDPTTGESLGLIHRDISPDNILLSRQGAVKVVDFGIAKASNQSHKTRTGLIKGKIAYMPLEQLQGQPLDRRVDVYALGVVLYELLTGHHPFEATTDVSMMQAILFEPLVPAASRRPDLPEALLRILDAALPKVREQRYPDCLALQADLERFILSTGQPMGARELAQWVERLCPKGSVTGRHPTVSTGDATGLESTALSPQRTPTTGKTRPKTMAAPALAPTSEQEPEIVLEPTRLSAHGLPPATEISKAADPKQEDVAPPPRRNRTGLGVAVGGLALLAAGSGVLFFRGSPAPQVPATSIPSASPPVKATPPPVAASRPAEAPPQVPPPPVVEQAALPTEPPPEQPVEAQAPLAAPAPQSEPAPRPKVSQKAKLTFRIRPYATVLLDGTALGQTPLAPVQVSIGTHTVRLINRDLGKDITRTVEVKAGNSNIFKHDFRTE
jgi:serine/threonine-protein kinase